jgi:hypothetical protein
MVIHPVAWWCLCLALAGSPGSRQRDLRCELEIAEPTGGKAVRLSDLVVKLTVRNVSDEALDLESGQTAVAASYLFDLDLGDETGQPVALPERKIARAELALSTVKVETLAPGGAWTLTVRLLDWLGWREIVPVAGRYQLSAAFTGASWPTIKGRVEESRARVRSQPAAFEVSGSHGRLADGQVTDGLRASLELVPDQTHYTVGQMVQTVIHVKNASDHTIAFFRAVDHIDEIMVGSVPHTSRATVDHMGLRRKVLWLLKPGEQLAFPGRSFRLVADGADPSPDGLSCRTGTHTLGYSLDLGQGHGARHGQTDPFVGSLRTGELEFEVVR